MLIIVLCCLPGRAITLLHRSGKFRTRDGCHSRKRCCTSFFAFDQRASDGWEEKNNQTENLHLLQKIVISTYSNIPLAAKKMQKADHSRKLCSKYDFFYRAMFHHLVSPDVTAHWFLAATVTGQLPSMNSNLKIIERSLFASLHLRCKKSMNKC